MSISIQLLTEKLFTLKSSYTVPGKHSQIEPCFPSKSPLYSLAHIQCHICIQFRPFPRIKPKSTLYAPISHSLYVSLFLTSCVPCPPLVPRSYSLFGRLFGQESHYRFVSVTLVTLALTVFSRK